MTETNSTSGPSDEAKAKFRAALDAKKAKSAKGSSQRGGTEGGVHGTDPVIGTRRQFRRKSG